jgi:hypothetical protein
MRSARNRRRKNNFVSKIKAFFVYSFISIVVLGFFLNTFLSNILEYSFALANSGGIADLKTDEKYSVVLISSNKLNEIKKFTLVTYDRKNRKLTNFNLNPELKISSSDKELKIGEILSIYKKTQLTEINKLLADNFGTNLALTFIASSDNFDLFEKIILGKGTLLDLYSVKDLDGVSLRDLYLIYSFSGSIDSQDKRDIEISSLEKLDNELRDIFIDSELGTLSSSITVINSTKINGLGKKYTRIINNLGGRVVDTTSGEGDVGESFIVYKENQAGLSYLASSLGIKKSLSMEEVGLKYPQIIKSDFVVVLGIDKEN